MYQILVMNIKKGRSQFVNSIHTKEQAEAVEATCKALANGTGNTFVSVSGHETIYIIDGVKQSTTFLINLN